MADLIVACVRTGTAYSIEHVTKLRDMVGLHLKRPHTVICLTDQPERCDGVTFIDVTEVGLRARWATMLLFEPSWRFGHKIIYFDLDTVIINDITPLAEVPGEFAIHEGVMVIGAGMASFIWTGFERGREELMRQPYKTAVWRLHPDAPSLQRMLPKGFFLDAVLLKQG